MSYSEIKNSFPSTDKNVMVVLSGGLDSSTVTIMLCEHYGAERVNAISFDYGQKQKIELQKAAELTSKLNVKHQILDLSILGKIARPFSANIAGTDISMPTIKDVLADPQPKTYVPNRNMIMYSIVAAAAEVAGAELVYCGVQSTDAYGYWDTTTEWVNRMNSVFSLNRKSPVTLLAPFSTLSKYEEILICKELGALDLLKYTLTCYNPNEKGESCGECPSCAERIAAFARAGVVDPVPYAIEIDWEKLFFGFSNV